MIDTLLQITYSPAINVYLVYAIWIYVVYWWQQLSSKSYDELTDKQKEQFKNYFNKNGEWRTWMVRLVQAGALPLLGFLNDVIFLALGGPIVVLYSKMWWGQFLPWSSITGFVS